MASQIPKSLFELAVPIKDLKPYSKNPRTGNIDALVESLKFHGQYRPVVVRRETSEILAGNHTYLAALRLGWDELAVTFVDCDDEEAARIVLVDNRSNDLAVYDDSALADLLGSLPTLDGTGFDQSAFDALLATIIEPVSLTDPDDVPDAPAEPLSVLGDVWLLGPHRVLCGDGTDVTAYETLLAGERADLVWTDPPYGVAVNKVSSIAEAKRLHRRTDGLMIENDELSHDELTDFLRSAFNAIYSFTRPGACWYVASPSGNLFQAFSIPLTELEVWRHTLVWVKDALVMGRADYHYRHESIFYGWTPGAAHQTPPDRKQDTVWEVARPKVNKEHPTMKPIALITRAINNSSNPGQLVIDPFGGSGSTLIACHDTNRVARLIELDPRYVDVICRRYQLHTGTLPILEATGEPHNFIKADA